MPVGERPTGIVVVTEFVAGSIRTTAPASRSATHTAPAPTATASAPSPTAIGAITSFVTGSIRAMLLPRASPTHTAPAPTATLEGLLSVSTFAVIAFPPGSSRSRKPASAATQTASPPAATLAARPRLAVYHPPTRPHDVEARIDLDQLGKAVGPPTDDPNAASPHSKTDRDSANRDGMNDLSAREVDAGNALIEECSRPRGRRCRARAPPVQRRLRPGP